MKIPDRTGRWPRVLRKSGPAKTLVLAVSVFLVGVTVSASADEILNSGFNDDAEGWRAWRGDSGETWDETTGHLAEGSLKLAARMEGERAATAVGPDLPVEEGANYVEPVRKDGVFQGLRK